MPKTIFPSILFLFFNLTSFGQSYLPTTDVLTNTFVIQTDTLSGTCFLVTDKNIEYIVTAKHLFKKTVNNNDSILFFLGRGSQLKTTNKEVLEPFKGKVYFEKNISIDIAVIKIQEKLSGISPYEASVKGSILGQDCYFLGFPYEEKFSTSNSGEVGKFAFIRKAIISAFFKAGDIDIDLLDGVNNPGFSGGPVIFYDYTDKKNKILGVISGYINQNDTLQIADKVFLNYVENSGIVICYPSYYITSIINRIN